MAIAITPKQLQILILLYRFRFLNRYHIQTILNHKDPKRINTWLKDLTNLKLIGRIYSTKLLENTKPAIYYLLPRSKGVMGHIEGVASSLFSRLYGDKSRSRRFIDHQLLLASFYLHLTKSNQGKVHFYTKTDLFHHPYLIQPLPDAYIALKKGKTTKRHFLEIIDEGTPRFVLRKRIEMYIEYYDTGEWTQATQYPFPKVLLLCPDEKVKKFLHRHISRVVEEEMDADLIKWFLATKDNLSWINALAETQEQED